MGRPVFPYPDRIVRENIDNRQLHDRAEPDRRLHIVGKDQEPRPERSQFRQGEAVADRAHGVLADAEMEISTAAVIGLEITRAFEGKPCLRRWREIGSTAEKPRYAPGDGGHHLAR